MSLPMQRIALFGVIVGVFLGMAGCGSPPPPPISGQSAAPTISSIFGAQPTLPPDPTRESPYVSALPTPDATVIAQATITALGADRLKEVVVYDDDLSSDWSLDHSFQTTIVSKMAGFTHKGRYAIKAQPQYTTGILRFTLNSTAARSFQRSRVQALRFYLSGGAEPIDNEALTVSVTGSNAYPYWVENDTSVSFDGRITDDQPLFSETRLSFLGINTAIPKKTYVEVTVWLNNLIYDPPYTYVTGFYLKTDKLSAPTFYVDQVSLLLTPDGR